jgi:rare lipoprotein A
MQQILQQKLPIARLLIVLSLLWTSLPSAAAPKATVTTVDHNLKLRYFGTASWYGKKHQGRLMANGQKFDRHKLTAASWFFPLGTMLRVVNINSGDSVIVTVTDRGPNHRLRRAIDLSEAAAQKLGFIEDGVTAVFTYPVVQTAIEPAALESALRLPSLPDAVQYQARAMNPAMQ